MLQDLDLLNVYDSTKTNIMNDLIIPLLSQAKLYWRGVGFFSSSWIQVASRGLIDIVRNGGKAIIIISPIISKKDFEAFKLGEEAKSNENLKLLLDVQMNDLEQGLEKNTLNALAWMIADGILDFRFAVAKNINDSDYHDKVGVVFDEECNYIAFHGSFNDSIKATRNYESFSVFNSWEHGQKEYAYEHKNRLEKLINNKNPVFHVYTTPEAIRNRFIKLRSEPRPYEINNYIELTNTQNEIFNFPYNLYQYQKDAIIAWEKSNFHGILEMATGTGKTLTSLFAASKRFKTLGKLSLLIEVPLLHLVGQWQKDCENIGLSPILCGSAFSRWQSKLNSRIQDFNLGFINQLTIISTHDTAANEKLKMNIKLLNDKFLMIISDEVHELGAEKRRLGLFDSASMRLGLSATPSRWYDERGTNILLQYFNSICYSFTLEDAIKGNFLTTYDYIPILVYLNNNEKKEYKEITKKLSKLSIQAKNNDEEINEIIKQLAIARARIIMKAKMKKSLLLHTLQTQKSSINEINNLLIYCAPGTHKEILKSVSDQGFKCHEIVGDTEINYRYEIFEQFAQGKIQAIVAIKCLDQGVNIPSTKYAHILASSTNPREFVQRRGRLLRKHPNKNNAVIYDYVVVPDIDSHQDDVGIDKSILYRELPRVAEFSSAARNKYQAREVFFPILNKYGLLNLFDKQSWEINNEKKKYLQHDSLIDLEDDL